MSSNVGWVEAESSHGFRPKRSAKDALREVERGLKAGKGYVVDAYIKRYLTRSRTNDCWRA